MDHPPGLLLAGALQGRRGGGVLGGLGGSWAASGGVGASVEGVRGPH